MRVGVVLQDPICFRRNSDFDGIGIHLLREIARELPRQLELIPVEDDDPLELLRDGSADAIIGVRPSEDDLDRAHYTQPFVTSSLAYVQPQSQTPLWRYAAAFFTLRFARIAASVSIVLLAVGVLCWLAERRRNGDQFRRSIGKGLWDGFYWAGVTMTTIGYGDKVPKSTTGKIVALLWMLAAIGITSILTASVVSVFNNVSSSGEIKQFPADLGSERVLAVAGSPAAELLDNFRIKHTTVEQLDEAIQALRSGNVDVVVDHEIALRAGTDPKKMQVHATHLYPQGFTIAVSPDQEPIYRQLQRGVLRETTQPDWHATLRRYTKASP